MTVCWPKMPRGVRGFTLLEILIAIFILSVVLSTIYASYAGTLRIIHELQDESRFYKTARMTLDRMTRDMTALSRSGREFIFISQKKYIARREFSNLTVWSAGHLAFEDDDASGALASITYFVREAADGSVSLWRSDVAGPKPAAYPEDGGGLILCPEIEALKMTFYDETGREHDSWDTAATFAIQKGKAPKLVRIELSLANAKRTEKPYKFMTQIFLPVRK